MDELRLEIGRDMRRHKGPKEFAERVAAKVREGIPTPENPSPLTKTGPYATGATAATVHVRQSRRRKGQRVGGQYMPTYEVYSLSDIMNLLEYGTGDDNPDSRSPWGPHTPTPVFAPFAKAAFFFGGTPDGG